MSDSSEPSYYEIALTNREVLVAFVAILCCVLAAFLGGVWLGRRGADRILAQEGITANAPAAAVEANSEVAQLEELRFFSEDEGEALAKPDLSPLKDNNKSKKDKTLAEDVGAKPELTAEERRERRQKRQERLEKKDDTANDKKDNDKKDNGKANHRKPNNKKNESDGTAKKPEVRPASSPTTPPSSPPSTPPPTAPAVTEGFVVQVFSSHDQVQARKVLAQLQGAGHKAFLSPVEVDAATMYRVRIGPFDDRADADKAAEGVKSAFKLDTWVTAASN